MSVTWGAPPSIAAAGGQSRGPERPLAVTFNKDIAPIIFRHCSSCHRPGEIGPFSLLTYRDVKQRASQIVSVTRDASCHHGSLSAAAESSWTSAGTDVFRTFVMPIPEPAARYVKALEFRPGNPRAVHHANLGVDRTRSSRRLDLRDPEPGSGKPEAVQISVGLFFSDELRLELPSGSGLGGRPSTFRWANAST